MSARANARSSYFTRVVFDRHKFSKVEVGLRDRGISTRRIGVRDARGAEGISFGGALRASHGRRASGCFQIADSGVIGHLLPDNGNNLTRDFASSTIRSAPAFNSFSYCRRIATSRGAFHLRPVNAIPTLCQEVATPTWRQVHVDQESHGRVSGTSISSERHAA